MRLPWETAQRGLERLKTDLLHELASPLLGVGPEGRAAGSQRDTRSPVFTTVSSTNGPEVEAAQRPLAGRRGTRAGECDSASEEQMPVTRSQHGQIVGTLPVMQPRHGRTMGTRPREAGLALRTNTVAILILRGPDPGQRRGDRR